MTRAFLYLTLALLLMGCSRTTNEYYIQDCATGGGALDSLRAANRRLALELEYDRFRLQECLGTGAAAAEARTALPLPPRKATAATQAAATPAPGVVEEVDASSGLTWYYDGRVPRDLGTTAFYLYMGRKVTGAPWLRLRAQYAGEHWLHIRGIRVHAGDLVFERQTDPAMVFSQADDLMVTEWSDVPPSKVELQMIARILAAPEARLTFLGHRGEHSRTITTLERDAFQQVLLEYEALALDGERR
jgi:hypothetical protein